MANVPSDYRMPLVRDCVTAIRTSSRQRVSLRGRDYRNSSLSSRRRRLYCDEPIYLLLGVCRTMLSPWKTAHDNN